MDVHKSGINVAVILPGEDTVSAQWQISSERRAIERMVRKAKRLGGEEVSFCYEAGPCGYDLQRQLQQMGFTCAVVAPSLIPVKPGERVKTDCRDSKKLVELLKADLLTEVHSPTPEEEAVRDITRAREDARKNLMSARHRLGKVLLRHGYIYREGCNWTWKHKGWIKRIRFAHPELQSVLENYLLAVEQIEERVKNLEALIGELAQDERYKERVGWLR
jgi:transposase